MQCTAYAGGGKLSGTNASRLSAIPSQLWMTTRGIDFLIRWRGLRISAGVQSLGNSSSGSSGRRLVPAGRTATRGCPVRLAVKDCLDDSCVIPKNFTTSPGMAISQVAKSRPTAFARHASAEVSAGTGSRNLPAREFLSPGRGMARCSPLARLTSDRHEQLTKRRHVRRRVSCRNAG